ncbi:hypothetical protein HET64_27170, partial [Streptomyces sp. McG3]|nr:hypothetical protein [Streptomyces sp. McG3]
MSVFIAVLVSVVVVGALLAGLRVTGGRGPSKPRAGRRRSASGASADGGG